MSTASHGGRGRLAHLGERRDVHHGEARERDQHGEAGEHHCGAGCPHRTAGCVLAVPALHEFMAVPRDDEQRIVDADRQSDHRRERR
jgi:hypothetical protein